MKIVILALVLVYAEDTSPYLHSDEKFHTDTQKITSAKNNERYSE